MKLADELRNDPQGIGYAQFMPHAPGMVVELINAKTQHMVKAIASHTALAWAASGPYSGIHDASQDKAHPCRASCLVIAATLVSGSEIDLSDPGIKAMFAAWVSTGIVTQAQSDDLYARATQPASRAEVLGIEAPNEKDVVTAWQM